MIQFSLMNSFTFQAVGEVGFFLSVAKEVCKQFCVTGDTPRLAWPCLSLLYFSLYDYSA